MVLLIQQQVTQMRKTGLIAGMLFSLASAAQESWVADPARGSTVERKKMEFMGKGFWYLLTPQWHQLPEVKEETFVKESGAWNVKWDMTRRNWNPPRVLLLRDLKVYAENGGRVEAVSAEVGIEAVEPGTKIYHPENLADGKHDTVCAVSGSIADPRTRFNPVGAGITVKLKKAMSLKRVILSYGDAGNPEIGNVKFLVNGQELKPASLERKEGVLSAIFTDAPQAEEFNILCESAPCRIQLEDFPPELSERLLRRPFASHLMRPVPFGLKPENFAREESEKLLRKYEKSHIGITFAEWDSQAFFQSWNPRNMFFNELVEFFGPEPRTREESEKSLHRFWNWHKSIFFDRIWGMSGAVGFPQYGMEWGGRVAGLELTNHTSTIPHRTLLRYTAGAGRQYGKPWLLYLAYYLGKFSPNSTRVVPDPKSRQWVEGPDAGISPSFSRRVFMTGYFMGMNFLGFEAQPWGQAENAPDGSVRLNENGKILKEFYEWIQSPGGIRGDWYTPILLLVDYHHGMMRRDGKIWGYEIPMEKGDWMGEHFRRAIDYYDGQGAAWNIPPYSHNMHNSTLGDIFDTAFGNPPSGKYPDFAEYPVVILTDDIRIDPELSSRLEKYVIGGGTLVMNSIHRKFFPTAMMPAKILENTSSEDGLTIPKVNLNRCTVMMKSRNGLPLALKCRYGNGNVLMTLPEYLLGDDKEQPTPYIGKMLESLQREVMPFQVEGDIQFIVSRLDASRWKLALINNKGILKEPWERKEKSDPAYTAKVTVTLPANAAVAEVYRGAVLRKENEKVFLEVPPGEVRILDIRNAPMASENGLPLIGEWKLDGSAGKTVGKAREKYHDIRYVKTPSGKTVYDASLPKTGILVEYNPGFPLCFGAFEFWASPNLNYTLSDRGGYPLASRFFRVFMNNRTWGLNVFDSMSVYGPRAEHDVWTHLAFTWDGGECRFFVNGTEYTSHGVPLKVFLPVWNNSFEIGTLGRGRRTFGGKISDVKLYSRALSPEEIRQLYENGKNQFGGKAQ